MVVSSQIIPNSVMLLALSRSFDALVPTDTSPGNSLLDNILVAHARVTVSYNGKTDTLFRVAPGFYGTIQTPLLDNVIYSLIVFDSSTGKSISASTEMKKRIFIDTAYLETKINKKDTARYLYIQFEDLVGEDYYMVNIYRNTEFIANSITNPLNIFNFNNSGDVSTRALSDQTFGNKKHLEKIDLGNFSKNDTCTVTLSHIGNDYYTYLIQKQKSEANGLGNFLGEPVNFITNVKGGYGFFTAHWPDAKILIFKE